MPNLRSNFSSVLTTPAAPQLSVGIFCGGYTHSKLAFSPQELLALKIFSQTRISSLRSVRPQMMNRHILFNTNAKTLVIIKILIPFCFIDASDAFVSRTVPEARALVKELNSEKETTSTKMTRKVLQNYKTLIDASKEVTCKTDCRIAALSSSFSSSHLFISLFSLLSPSSPFAFPLSISLSYIYVYSDSNGEWVWSASLTAD